ncbi:MAG: ATP-binding protein [Myxococcales bacterium]
MRAIALAFACVTLVLAASLLLVGMDTRVVVVPLLAAPLFAAVHRMATDERRGQMVAVLLNCLVTGAVFAAVAANRQIGPGPAFVGFSLFVAGATLPLRGVIVSAFLNAGAVIAMGVVSRNEVQLPATWGTATTYGLALCVVTAILSAIQVRNARRALKQVVTRERQAVALESQLQQAQKMDALGRMAAAVAHDFNNLLTVIQGAIQIASLNENLAGHTSEILKAADKAAADATQLTKRLLAFSRKEAEQLSIIDSRATLCALADLLPRVLGPSVRLEVGIPSELPSIIAGSTHVEQVLLNLAINARDAMPNGGTLYLQARERAEAVEDDRAHRGRWLEIKVRDTGTGMPPHVISRLFEPFFTTKAEGKGTGLGLSTCYGIIRRLGGSIRATSTEGVGTDFVILLPAAGKKA